MGLIEILTPILGPVLQNLFPDPVKRAEAEAQLQQAILAQQQVITDRMKMDSDLAIAETNTGRFWTLWRPALSWVLIGAILIEIILNPFLSLFGLHMNVDGGTLQNVSTLWLTIYAGGHTVKFAAEKVADAVVAKKAG